MDHEYKLENDAHCLGRPQHEIKKGTKLKFDTYGNPHCPTCNAIVMYSW